MEQAAAGGGEGNGLDLSALLGSFGQDGGPDLSGLLELVKGTAPEGQDGEKPGEGLDFAALLGMLGGIGGGGNAGVEGPPAGQQGGPPAGSGGGAAGPPPFDPALLTTFRRAMEAMREPDRNIRLLEALRPFLEPERRWKVDEAIKFLHLMKLAPLLQNLPLDI